MKNKRQRFFIDKPLQTRFALYVAATLLTVSLVSGVGLYFGIWGSVIESFSDERLYQEIQTAARIQDYEHSRVPVADTKSLSSLRLFREINLLSARQREILQDILVRANTKLLWQGILLTIMITCGSVYITHKVAGPFFHFRKSFNAVNRGHLKTRIYLRKNDEGKSVAKAFNEMMESLDHSVSNMKQLVHRSGPSDLKKKLETELSKFDTTNS